MKTRQCLCFTEILNTSDYIPHKLNSQSAPHRSALHKTVSKNTRHKRQTTLQ